VQGQRLRLFEARKHPARRYEDVRGKPGEICAIGDTSIEITVQGGRLEILKVRGDGGPKVAAAEFARAHGLVPGSSLAAGVQTQTQR
jgi:methionyl-tRNA formyltransferase